MLELFLLSIFSSASPWPKSPAPMVNMTEVWDVASWPQKKASAIEPQINNAKQMSWVAIDLPSGKTLLQKNAYRSRPIASLSKIMVYLLIAQEHKLNEVVSIAPEATKVGGVQADLYAYEKITVNDLLEIMLVGSANDAAVALAIYNAGTEELFVEKMNKLAAKLELGSAHFVNATGLDTRQKSSPTIIGNRMSVHDLAILTRIALRDPWFAQTVQKTEAKIISVDGRFEHFQESTNQLLGEDSNSRGVKTGYTKLAGQCLINLSITESGEEILTIILGSDDRFGETRNLLDWLQSAYIWY